MALFPVFALTAPPVTVALLDGPQFASMALLALVLSALSIAVRRSPPADPEPRRRGHTPDGRRDYTRSMVTDSMRMSVTGRS